MHWGPGVQLSRPHNLLSSAQGWRWFASLMCQLHHNVITRRRMLPLSWRHVLQWQDPLLPSRWEICHHTLLMQRLHDLQGWPVTSGLAAVLAQTMIYCWPGWGPGPRPWWVRRGPGARCSLSPGAGDWAVTRSAPSPPSPVRQSRLAVLWVGESGAAALWVVTLCAALTCSIAVLMTLCVTWTRAPAPPPPETHCVGILYCHEIFGYK